MTPEERALVQKIAEAIVLFLSGHAGQMLGRADAAKEDNAPVQIVESLESAARTANMEIEELLEHMRRAEGIDPTEAEASVAGLRDFMRARALGASFGDLYTNGGDA